MLAANWRDKRQRIEIIWSIPDSDQDNSRIRFDQWREWKDGSLARFVYVPPRMGETGRRHSYLSGLGFAVQGNEAIR